ncbi:MAG: DUF5688 family protein [Blautia sp.]|nr:DUF5688 family protein [Blautia sp.]
MNYQDFLADIRTQLSAQIEPDAILRIQTMPRNNGTFYDGLVILRPGRNISPAIYLTPYYHRYLAGVSMEDIYADILSAYRRHLPEEDFDTSMFTNFEKVHSRIIMRLINYARNEELLQDVPHFLFQDLAVVFYCLLHASDENQASILIHNEHLALWGIDGEQIYALAKKNTPRLMPFHIRSMQELLHNFHSSEFSAHYDCDPPMLVITNRFRTNGASVLLYEGLLASFARHLHANLLILPSSVHEIILLPVEDDSALAAASRIVQEVNETQLTDEEVLSDHAYYYDRLTKRLTCPS